MRFFVDGGWTVVCWAGVVKDRGGLRLDHGPVGVFTNYSTRVEYLFPEADAGDLGSDGPVFRLRSYTFGNPTTSPFNHDYHPLFDSSVPAALAPADPVLETLFERLWVGTYGPHGDEVLLLRMVRLEEEEEGVGGAPGRVICEGLKITGDPNVPAGKWSFRVDLDRPCDMAEAIASDPRPIYTMTASGPIQHVLLDLEEEMQAGRLHGIYPGQGQINRVPLTWNPETVGVDLVAWKENARRRLTFGLVWHDDDHAVRHCITFYPVPNDGLDAWMGKLGQYDTRGRHPRRKAVESEPK